jgi:hypothetical protein
MVDEGAITPEEAQTNKEKATWAPPAVPYGLSGQLLIIWLV